MNKRYSERTLRKFRQFYIKFSDKKWSTLWTILQWSHYKELMSMNDDNEIKYYINLSLEQNLSVRQLRERIKNKEYEKLDDKTKIKLINKEKTKVQDFIKNPILIKNKYNKDGISEKMLQDLILEDIPFFLKELGNGFSFIDNEYPIKIGNRYNYINLLLYNTIYKCYVVLEPKTTELKKEHIGQIETYMNYVDKNIKADDYMPTIGIIILYLLYPL